MKNRLFYALPFLLVLFFLPGKSYGQDVADTLKEETLSYFRPLKGKVLSVQDGLIMSDLGPKTGIKKGMRLAVLREGTPFLHPVTKEVMGKMETPAGRAEVKDISGDGSALKVVKGNAAEGDILRISEIKVRILFFQDRSVDWSLGERYYQSLRESGRFDLVDSSLDSGDNAKIVDEAKKLNTDAVIILTSKESGKEFILNQRILWTEDSSELASTELKIDASLMKEARAGSLTATLSSTTDALLFFDLPFGARLLSSGDLKGDGKQELIISTGGNLEIFEVGGSLHSLYEFKGSASDDYIWIDTMDIDGNGRDEIIVTSMKSGEIYSYIYELRGSELSLVWTNKLFLRAIPSLGLIAQKYDAAEGFSGPVFAINYNSGRFDSGGPVMLPAGVNIYDFIYLPAPNGSRNILAYDDAGYLNLYNEGGLRIWRSKEAYGGFHKTFKRTAPTVMVERGEWAVKDRLFLRSGYALVVKKIPLASMVKGLGYKSSQIKMLWWTGLSMEEINLVEHISGGVFDYTVAGDRLIVLSRPIFGLKPKNILKGENPLGGSLYVYSLKGR